MVQLTRIYTKSGDKGKSSLGDGTRRLKHDLRFEAIGEVDELNSQLGVVDHYAEKDLKALIHRIQNDLFDLGADLAVPVGEALRINENQVVFIEEQIDLHNKDLQPLKSFILPGGTILSSHLHVVRTVARRAERKLVALNQEETINVHAMHYINRLSDLFFVLARLYNNMGQTDILWVPGENR